MTGDTSVLHVWSFTISRGEIPGYFGLMVLPFGLLVFLALLDMVLSFDYPQFDPHEMRICPTLNKNAGPVRCISCVSTNSASGALKPCSTLRCMVKGVDIPGQPKFGAFKETFHMRNCSGVGLGQTPRPGVPGPEAGFGGSRQKLFGKCFLTACFLGGVLPLAHLLAVPQTARKGRQCGGCHKAWRGPHRDHQRPPAEIAGRRGPAGLPKACGKGWSLRSGPTHRPALFGVGNVTALNEQNKASRWWGYIITQRLCSSSKANIFNVSEAGVILGVQFSIMLGDKTVHMCFILVV